MIVTIYTSLYLLLYLSKEITSFNGILYLLLLLDLLDFDEDTEFLLTLLLFWLPCNKLDLFLSTSVTTANNTTSRTNGKTIQNISH